MQLPSFFALALLPTTHCAAVGGRLGAGKQLLGRPELVELSLSQ